MMHSRWMWAGACGLAWAALAGVTRAAVPNSLLLNEANTVGGDYFLDEQNRNRGDLTLGRIQGNGQNWIEFLVVQGDELGGGQFANTLDLRGWKVQWQYDKNDPLDPNKLGQGTITFSQDPLWAKVPRGSLVTINEWKEVWYRDLGMDPGNHGGLSRIGGINGLGEMAGEPKLPTDALRNFATDTTWNPNANGGGAAGDWTIHVWAGERNADQSFKYFQFEGQIVNGAPETPIPIGTTAGGLYAVNNDNWQWTIRDNQTSEANPLGNIIQGPYGEALSNGGWSVNTQELFRLEAFPATASGPTQATYLATEVFDYQDGTSSAYGKANVWSGGSISQSLAPLRNWLVSGDADLNGVVNGNDFVLWQRNLGATGASLSQGDFNGDGTVNAADLAIWKSAYPAAAAAATAVPEASTMALGAVAAACFSAVRKRRQRRSW